MNSSYGLDIIFLRLLKNFRIENLSLIKFYIIKSNLLQCIGDSKFASILEMLITKHFTIPYSYIVALGHCGFGAPRTRLLRQESL